MENSKQVPGNAETRTFDLNFRKSLSVLTYVGIRGKDIKLVLNQCKRFLLTGCQSHFHKLVVTLRWDIANKMQGIRRNVHLKPGVDYFELR